MPSDIIDKKIVHFKIKDDYTIKIYSNEIVPPPYKKSQEQQYTDIKMDTSNNDNIDDSLNNYEKDSEISLNKEEKFRWSFDISNVCMHGNKYFVFVAVSRIDDEDLIRTTKKIGEKSGNTVIYPIELLKDEKENYTFNKDSMISLYHTYGVSGICRFVEASDDKECPNSKNYVSDSKCFILKKLVVLNFHGIHSYNCDNGFQLNKKFKFPKCIRRKLDSLSSSEISECINILLSRIYDKYFLVEQYKNNVQLLEGNYQIFFFF